MQLLETLWEASDHRCGKRLAAVWGYPGFVDRSIGVTP